MTYSIKQRIHRTRGGLTAGGSRGRGGQSGGKTTPTFNAKKRTQLQAEKIKLGVF